MYKKLLELQALMPILTNELGLDTAIYRSLLVELNIALTKYHPNREV